MTLTIHSRNPKGASFFGSSIFLGVVFLLGTVLTVRAQDNWELYRNAIQDASVYSHNKVISLRLLRPESGRVQVVTFSSYAYNIGPYHVPAGRYIWVTGEGEVQAICKQWQLQGDSLRLRLSQLLGLPPNSTNTHMVTFSVPQDRIFRPAPDPNPATVYPCAPTDMAQCGNALPQNAAPEHMRWYIGQTLGAYRVGQSDGENGYPWTHLGYTYNWTPYAPSKYGASEYVIKPDTDITVISRTPIDEYCRQ
jgi:hypothetical protein